ncbi:hypothetical protein D088_660024 [Salmonella enterica subsp. houtenae serovar 16:z4,z32:-- str. RKS3027]|nr:hypothetical protein D088_660024 [Salmonella enterica subsp. houtenae serovar 16:z4,z32:-- str. RKS3027]
MVCVTQCNRFVKQKAPADAGPFDRDIPQIEAVDRHISHALKRNFSYNIHLSVFFFFNTCQHRAKKGSTGQGILVSPEACNLDLDHV